ncbi:MAG: hypothetical protein EWV64_07890 [Microcystis flos-aquae Ma_QC_C_20070823_S18]|nr:MAG: hypothetical protein EWV64_07890 [Microcystis flos-aquae Ma_QC_C_20070823_S18]TRV32525.1 MAG: hypothetical protein EWV71_18065 [Microcystis flos-aquae Mf_QC_C_20070823_S20D]
MGIISQLIGGRKLCAPTVTDFVHNVGANCVRPKGTLSKRKSLTPQLTLFLSNYLILRMYENASIGQKLNDAFLSSKNRYICNPKQINSD